MKNRVIWKMFLFTVLTLGIYRLWWFVKTRKEMMSLNPDIKILSPFFLLLPILLIVITFSTFMISIFQSAANQPSYCKTYTNTTYENSSNNIPSECQSDQALWPIVIFYIAIFAFGPLVAVWLWGYAKGVEKITNEKTSFAMSMIVLLLVPDGIDILIIQDGFNKLNSATPTTAYPTTT